MRWLGTFGLLFLCLLSSRCQIVSSSSLTGEEQPGYRRTISQASDFDGLAGRVQSGQTENAIVKVLYRRTDGDLFFINTQRYPYHYDFATAELGVRESVRQFNQNYVGDGADRRFNAASLVQFQRSDQAPLMLLEIWNGDEMTAPYFAELFRKVRQHYQLEQQILFHPLSATQEAMIPTLQQQFQIESIKSVDLYQGQDYIALNRAAAYGYIRFVREGAEETCLDHTSIVVYDRVPNEIGLYAGVITEQFQTPLSHVNVKSINRGTGNMVLRDAMQKLAEYQNRPVKLEIRADRYVIEPLDPDTADRRITEFWDARRPQRQLQPNSADDPQFRGRFLPIAGMFSSVRSLVQFQTQHRRLTLNFGAKATNLGLIHRFIGDLARSSQGRALDVTSPDGFGVPFSYYDAFMDLSQAGLDPDRPDRQASPRQMIDEILAGTDLLNGARLHSICEARPVLQRIRELITRSQVPPALLAQFQNVILQDRNSPVHQSRVPRIRLRSSTNSEDLPGFNGAGLYNSKGVNLYKKDDEGRYLPDRPQTWEKISKKLKERIPIVYSSVWNDRAFAEREWFRMNGPAHLAIKVGIAVHRAFPRYDLRGPGELANGVATSNNIYEPSDRNAVYINAQHYDLAVTNPPDPEDLEEYGEDPNALYTTEEILITPYLADPIENQRPDAWRRWSYNIIGRSSVRDGEPVLRDDADEIRRVAYVINYLSDRFAPVYRRSRDDFVIDSEWKLFGSSRRLWVKQGRPLDDGGGEEGINDDARGIAAPIRQPYTPRGPRQEAATD